jgi:chorismate mutase/prephenate dehydratase
MSEAKINNPRAEIDRIDGEILRLLNERAAIALKVGAAKANVDVSMVDPKRESEVLARLSTENKGPFDEQSITNIFQRIIDESLHLQQKTYRQPTENKAETRNEIAVAEGKPRVAFQGEKGSFSEAAILQILGENCETVPRPTFDDLYRAIEENRADYILSPLENSLVGSIHRCYDLLLNSSLHIIAETVLPVSHFLIAAPNAGFETIKTVESHPAALAQCERFFAAHPDLKGIAADDTAGSVKNVVESGDITRAAIGGKRTAEIYGGVILREHIEDHAENYTRFGLLSAKSDETEKGTKISLVIRLNNKPGALHSALRPFVRRGIDLLKIESRPIKHQPSQINF